MSLRHTYSLHGSSSLGLPFEILKIDLVKPKKGSTMETRGKLSFGLQGLRVRSGFAARASEVSRDSKV